MGFLLALAAVLGRGHPHPPVETLARLVYVEPAAPPAPPLVSGAGRTSRAEVPASAEPATETERREAKEPPAVSRLTAHTRRRAEPAHAEPAPPPPIAVPPAGPSSGPGSVEGVNGGHGDTIGGTADGVTGGLVGRLGSTPLALRDVASPPALIHRLLPDYPPRARALAIEGQVVLEVVLDQAGRVEEPIRVVRSIAQLDAAAIAAVKEWRFRPARDREGRAVRVRMEIPVHFVLR